jgi:hypothetical protein
VKHGGRIVLGVLTAIFRPSFWRKVRDNRRAVRAGLPKPTPPGELIVEALEMGGNAALPAVRNDKVREGIERGLEMLDAVDTDVTPREKPPTHRGLK